MYFLGGKAFGKEILSRTEIRKGAAYESFYGASSTLKYSITSFL
jgi:hypothetical protein